MINKVLCIGGGGGVCVVCLFVLVNEKWLLCSRKDKCERERVRIADDRKKGTEVRLSARWVFFVSLEVVECGSEGKKEEICT